MKVMLPFSQKKREYLVLGCWGGRNFPLLGSFGWSVNQIVMTKVNKRKITKCI